MNGGEKSPAKAINMFSREEISNKLTKYNPGKVIQMFTNKDFKFDSKNIEKTNSSIEIMAYNIFNNRR